MARAELQKVIIDENVRLELCEMGSQGDTLATHDGAQISVFGGIPGEVVDASIRHFKRQGRQMAVGQVVTVIEASRHRVVPPCPYYGPCTGCDWQHISYQHQLHLKKLRVQEALKASPELSHVLVSETLPSPQEFEYRNHARLTVRRHGQLGFVSRITRRWTRVDECMLMTSGINQKLRELQEHCGDTTQLSIRYGINTDDWLIQPRLSMVTPTGQTHYNERLLGATFRVASPSFFQVNTRQTEQLISLLIEQLGPANELTVVDAYAGVGTFAVLLAPHVKRMIAIEESAAAIKDSRANSSNLDNVEFVEGKVESVLPSFRNRLDVLILDPPRAGCHPDVVGAVAKLRPPRVIYVSCVPETASRDLTLLSKGGYVVENVQPVDMFPQTHHVECIATLRLA